MNPHLSLTAGLLALCAACAPAQADTAPPLKAGQTNVLLIVLDTTRADHMSAYGYEHPPRP